MNTKSDELARLMTLEMGKRIDEARGEVAFSARIHAYYAKNAERFLAPEKLHPAVGEAHMESSPIGVIFCVEPWNFPYYQLARVAGPHLMAGNVLMVKHASNVPQCAIAFEKLWIEADAPVGLYTNLLISHDQANHVVVDARIKGVALTGSEAAGRSIAARAGQNLKPSSLELGGSDAFIVLKDADLEHTIKWAVWGRMYNDGQTCVAAKRFIVAEELADTFLKRFQAELVVLKPGDPMDKETTLGLYGVKTLSMGINLRRRLSLGFVDDTSQDISPPYWTSCGSFSSWNGYRKFLTDPLMWTSMVVVFVIFFQNTLKVIFI